MIKVTCPECRGRGYDVEVYCPDCNGTGYDPNEDNSLAQCHTCYGSKKVEAEICPKCDGKGQIEIEYGKQRFESDLDDDLYECSVCSSPADYVLVDYHHNIIGDGILYCYEHAFDNNREQCPCCRDYLIDVDGLDFLPTYPSGALDGQGCCSEHP